MPRDCWHFCPQISCDLISNDVWDTLLSSLCNTLLNSGEKISFAVSPVNDSDSDSLRSLHIGWNPVKENIPK